MIYNIPFSTIPYFSFSHFPFPISHFPSLPNRKKYNIFYRSWRENLYKFHIIGESVYGENANIFYVAILL